MRSLTLFFTVTMLLFVQHGHAQQKMVRLENFDVTLPPLNWSVTSQSVGAWIPDTTYYLPNAAGTQSQSYHGLVSNIVGDSTILETEVYDCSPYEYVCLRFSHICKISPRDEARIEYRINVGGGMGAWSPLPDNGYLGSGYYNSLVGFNAATYAQWDANDSLVIPQQSWWREELFDLTGLANQTSVQFRFVIKHGAVPGTHFSYGWLLENFLLEAGHNEILPPVVQFVAPFVKDTVFVVKPFEISAKVKSRTTALLSRNPYLNYTASSNGSVIESDSVLMTTIQGDSLWKATIKEFAPGTEVVYSITERDMLGNEANANFRYVVSKPYPGAKGYIYYAGEDATPTGGSANIALIYNASLTTYWSRILYIKSELAGEDHFDFNPTTPAVISKIAWYSRTVTAASYLRTIKVYLQATNETRNLSPFFIDPETNGATLVYDGPTNSQLTWNEVVFTTPFTLPAGSNLMVYIQDNTGVASAALRECPTWAGRTEANRTVSQAAVQALCPLMRFGIELGTYGNNSVALTHILSPEPSTVVGGQNTAVKVVIQNRGNNDLDSCWIEWTLNDTLQTPVLWKGHLTWNLSDTVDLGNYIPRTNQYDIIHAWVSMPNGVLDPILYDDELTVATYGCGVLSGDYTVGEEKHFETLSDALYALKNCGVSGDVRFLLKSGTYPEEWDFTNFGNEMNGYMLTITSEANHRDSVIIKPEPENMIVIIGNTRNLTFDALTFDGSESVRTNIVQFFGTCTNLVINNCNILCSQNITSSATGGSPIYKGSGTGVVDSFRLTNCLLDGGSWGICFYGGTGSAIGTYGTNIIMDSNVFTNSFYRPIETSSAYITSISHNIIRGKAAGANSSTTWSGIYFTGNANIDRLVGNSIIQRNHASYGIYFGTIGGCVVDVPKPSLIANNEILTSSTSGTPRSISFGGAGVNSMPIYCLHNSMYLDGVGNGQGIYFQSSMSNAVRFVIKKNIIHANTTGTTTYAMYLGTAFNTGIYAIDSNNYYSTVNIGYATAARQTLAAWRGVVTSDQNSTDHLPIYINLDKNLKLKGYNDFLCDRDGQVLEDIEGLPRENPTAKGCYRVIPPFVDAALENISGIKTTGANAGETDTLKVELLNDGMLTFDTITLCWSINGVNQTSVVYTDSLPSGDRVTVTLGEFTYKMGRNTAEVYICGVNAQSPDIEPNNDTIRTIGYVCLESPISGTVYLPTEYPDLDDFADAVVACGVLDTITLDFGKYTGNLDFNAVASRLDNTPLIITGDTIYALAGNAVTLGNNRNITFKDVVIQGSENAHVINFINSCTNIVIRNCTLLINPATTSTTAYCIHKSASNTGRTDSIIIVGNTLEGGYYGMLFYGGGAVASVRGTNFMFDSNRLNNQSFVAARIETTDLISCSYNTVLGGMPTSASWYGIYGRSFNGPIIGNRIIQTHTGTATVTGIYSSAQNSSFNLTGEPGLIANNEIILKDNAEGIYTVLSSFSNIINNSIYISGAGCGIYLAANTGNTNIQNNNIVMIDSAACPIYFARNVGGGFLSLQGYNSDYNNLYAPVFAVSRGTSMDMATWRITTGFDMNSVIILPVFVDESQSLEMPYYYIEFDCPQHADLPFDINNHPRTTPTTMGAYESSTLAEYEHYDLTFTQLIIQDDAGSACASDYVSVQFVVSNDGYSTYNFNQETLALHFHIDGMKGIFDTVVYITSGSLATEQTDTFNLMDFVDVAFAGDYEILAWISSPKDVNYTNDTLHMTYKTNKIALPYSEDFSAMDMTYLGIELVNGTKGWEVVQGADSLIAPAQGTGMLVMDAPLSTISSVKIGQIELNRTVEPVLEFWYAHDNNDPDKWDQLDVRVTWNGGASGKVIERIMRYDANYTTPGWKQYSIDLSPYIDSACVVVHLDAFSYGGIQHIDKIAMVSGQSLALEALLIDDYAACDLYGKAIKAIFSNYTNQSVDFSQVPTSLVLNIRGAVSKDTVIVLSHLMEGLATDTITLLPGFDFNSAGTYNLTAYINSMVNDANLSDDTVQQSLRIYPDITVTVLPTTGGTNNTNCIAANTEVSPEVIITNKGNLDVYDIPVVLVTYGPGPLDTLVETIDFLPAGSNTTLRFTETYTVPYQDNYNVVVSAFLSCDSNTLDNEGINLMECVDLEDIGLVSLVSPSGSGLDDVGSTVYLEVTLANYGFKTYSNVDVHAIIYDGVNTFRLIEMVTNLGLDTITTCIFKTGYQVPAASEYTITVFLSSVDLYPLNDTLPPVTRYTNLEDDIAIIALVSPSGSIDNIGSVINIEVTVGNRSATSTYQNIGINAIISDGVHQDMGLFASLATLAPGETKNCRFAATYLVPAVAEYTITVFLNSMDQYPSTDTLPSVTRYTNFGDDDIVLLGFVTPSGSFDEVGSEITLEVQMTNNSPAATYDTIVVHALIEADGNQDVTFTEIVTNFVEGTTRNCVFSPSYTVPNVPYYTITVFIDNVDEYPTNDTIRITDRKTSLLLENDIALKAIRYPVQGTIDNVGSTINLEVEVENLSPSNTYPAVGISARITNGADPDIAIESFISNFAPGVQTCRFNSAYTVPSVSDYTITVFVSKIDENQENDTLTIDRTTNVGISNYSSTNFTLGQNIPNPAKDNTRIEYSIPEDGQVLFTVSSITGQNLYIERKDAYAGKNEIEFNTINLANGIYYYSMEYKGERLVKKMNVQK